MHFLPSIWGCLWILVYTRSFITFIDKDKCSALLFGTQEATGTLRYKYSHVDSLIHLEELSKYVHTNIFQMVRL